MTATIFDQLAGQTSGVPSTGVSMFDRVSRVALSMTALLVSLAACASNKPAVAVGTVPNRAPAAAQGFEYAVGTSQYKVTQTAQVTQEAMGQKQNLQTSSNQVFTTAIRRASKDTLIVTSVIDSITAV